MPTDRRIESAHFKSFRRLAVSQAVVAVPDGQVTHAGVFALAPDGMPDFLIAADRVLGIEHREILKAQGESGGSERAYEQHTDDVLKMAQELSELRSLPHARVSVLFGNTAPASRQGRLALARSLEQLVHDHMPEDRNNIRLEWEHFRGRNLHGVDTVFIHRDDRLAASGRWVAPRAGWVKADCIALIQEAINDKAPKLESYLRHCAECWLLLVADSRKPSASIHPSDESLAHEYTSPFARTFFLDYGMGQLHALLTRAPYVPRLIVPDEYREAHEVLMTGQTEIPLTADFGTERYITWVRDNCARSYMWAIDIDGRMAGVMLARPPGQGLVPDATYHELTYIAVRPERRRRGLGPAFLAHAKAKWSPIGAQAKPSNAAVQRMLTTAGFRLINECEKWNDYRWERDAR